MGGQGEQGSTARWAIGIGATVAAGGLTVLAYTRAADRVWLIVSVSVVMVGYLIARWGLHHMGDS